MGVGKSTVGRSLAQRLGSAFFDSDHEIENLAHMPIKDIFANKGEAAFRAMERAYIEHGIPESGCVIACGGGLIVQPGMIDLVSSKGIIICLHASLETIMKRVAGHSHRPLLNVDDQETRLRTLYAERDPMYRKVGTTILTDNRSLNEIVLHVIRTYRKEAADWQAEHRAAAGP
jgi:shikimate kinase